MEKKLQLALGFKGRSFISYGGQFIYGVEITKKGLGCENQRLIQRSETGKEKAKKKKEWEKRKEKKQTERAK